MVFGRIGQSWKGCFAGGRYLVLAVIQGVPNENSTAIFRTTRFLLKELRLGL